MRALARESDRKPQFKEAQTLGSGHAPQLFGCFAVKRRFRVDENVQQTWLVNFVDRVKSQLYPVGEELFKLGVDGIVDPAQTADRLAFAGNFRRQTRGTVCAHRGLTLQKFDLGGRLFDPFELVGARRTAVYGSQDRVQVAETAPLAQMPLRIARAQNAWVLNGEFERHGGISWQLTP